MTAAYALVAGLDGEQVAFQVMYRSRQQEMQ